MTPPSRSWKPRLSKSVTAAALIGISPIMAHAFDIDDMRGERGQSINLSITLNDTEKAAIREQEKTALIVLGLPVHAWLSVGSDTGRGWRIEGPALATALRALQLTTTNGAASAHLLEFQLKMAPGEPAQSRLSALTLTPTPENSGAPRAMAKAPSAEPKQQVTDASDQGAAQPSETAPSSRLKRAAVLPKPTPLEETKGTDRQALDPITTAQQADPVSEATPKQPERSLGQELREAPTRLAALIPRLWQQPKPKPSRLGAADIPTPSAPTSSPTETLVQTAKDASRPDQAGQGATSIEPSKARASQVASVPAPTAPIKPSVPSVTSKQPPAAAMDEGSRRAKEQNDPLFKRARQLVTAGDVAGARLLFEHLANAGNATAAFLMARSYELDFLQANAVRGLRPNPDQATAWHSRARELGYAK